MKNNLSFTDFIKNEILDFNWDEEQLKILFLSFLKTSGIIKNDNFKIGSSLKNRCEKFLDLFEKFFIIKPKITYLETKCNFRISNDEFISKFIYEYSNIVLNSNDKIMAFIAGAFLSRGWISKPTSRFYHLELRICTMDHLLNLQEAIDSMGIKSKTLKKSNWFIIYFKKSLDIADLLKMMHAQESMMIFEEERINRDFSSTYSKMENIEQLNFKKTKEVSELQIKAINKLKKTNSLYKLKNDLINLTKIREEFPDFSLSDIQYMYIQRYGKDVSKSTINNWFKIIINMSKLIEE